MGHMRPLPGLLKPDEPLAMFLRANPRAFSRAELVRRWSRRALESAVAGGTVTRVLPGVYCATAHASLGPVRGEAINLWHPAGLITGPLALHLYKAELPPPATAHLHVARGHQPLAPDWIHCHQGEVLHRWSYPEGVRSASPARALLDTWRFLPVAERRNVLWEALWARICTWHQLKRETEMMYRIAGRRDLERVLGWFAEGATSPLEVRAKHEVFHDARFSAFEWQVDLQLKSRDVTVDMLHRKAAVVVELDGE